jgi:chromosome segregation ATPase
MSPENSLDERLTIARRHMRQAEERIENQLATIEELKAQGHDVKSTAEKLLAAFLKILDQFTSHCEELEKNLRTPKAK